jgi:hypothetical protein
MKKFFALLTVVAALTVGGCTKSEPVKPATPPAAPESPAEPAEKATEGTP